MGVSFFKPKFRIGDMVKIRKSFTDSPPSWDPAMDETIGEIGTVKGFSPSGFPLVRFKSGASWIYVPRVLEFIRRVGDVIEDPPGLKVGDKVKIAGRFDDSRLHWNPRMDRTIGKVGVVARIDGIRFHVLIAGKDFRNEDSPWVYLKEALERVYDHNYEVGDKVKIVKAYDSDLWNIFMDSTIGTFCKIEKVTGRTMRLDNGFYYDFRSLELVMQTTKMDGIALGDAVKFDLGKVGIVVEIDDVSKRYLVEYKHHGKIVADWRFIPCKLEGISFSYYRVPEDLYELPEKNSRAKTEQFLRPYVVNGKWNFAPASRGGAVVAKMKYGEKHVVGESVCSLDDNFSYKEGRRLAILDMRL